MFLQVYMNGGGVQALLGDDDDKGGLSEEEVKVVEEEFQAIFQGDDKLRQALQGQDPTTLTIKEKYEILVAYKKGSGVQGLLGREEEDEESVIEHNGMKFKRVQIVREAQEYLMDEAGTIHDGEFNFIGQANINIFQQFR